MPLACAEQSHAKGMVWSIPNMFDNLNVFLSFFLFLYKFGNFLSYVAKLFTPGIHKIFRFKNPHQYINV